MLAAPARRLRRCSSSVTFDLFAYARLRPYLYHLTARRNLPRIQSKRTLESAASLARQANEAAMLGSRRDTHRAVVVDGTPVMLRDQSPLHERNMRLEDGWTFERFIAHLNERVFFWPGGDTGPNDYGLRHFTRYQAEQPVIVRVPFISLCNANPQAVPLFAKYNSGSPRWSGGAPPVRGPRTFISADTAPFTAGDVVEVTFQGGVTLPTDAVVADAPSGAWTPLI